MDIGLVAIRYDVTIPRLKRIQKALGSNVLYAGPYRETVTALAQKGESTAGRSAPKGRTGQLEAQIVHAVQKRPLPLWFSVKSRAKSRSRAYPRGYFYGRLLNYSRKHGHLGWFTTPLKRLGQVATPLLRKAAQQIEANWGRLT